VGVDVGGDEVGKLKSEVANLESRLRAKCDKTEYYARLRKKDRSEYEDPKSKALELESKLADERDDESAPAQAQADEARLADDGATYIERSLLTSTAPRKARPSGARQALSHGGAARSHVCAAHDGAWKPPGAKLDRHDGPSIQSRWERPGEGHGPRRAEDAPRRTLWGG